MKRIVIACDGTWNRLDAENPTNVAKLVQSVLPVAGDGVAQVACHLDGVGSGRGTGWLARKLDRALGGMLGQGLMATVAEAYRFLVFSYAPGDEIYLFGFSRGAYMARSLAGLIRTCGILRRANAAALPAAVALYQRRDRASDPEGEDALAFRLRHASHVMTGDGEAAWRAARGAPAGIALRLAYVGVWDTVGALGLPNHMALAARLNRGLGFHDTALWHGVRAARHAVALDERRRTFPPTLWDNLASLNAAAGGGRYAQLWFPGDHTSVGGGGHATALSDDALAWVAEGAIAAGLGVDPAALAGWRASRDWRGPLSARSRPTLLGRLLALDAGDRAGPTDSADVAPAALARWRNDTGYRPASLTRVASSLVVDVARCRAREGRKRKQRFGFERSAPQAIVAPQ